MAESTTKVPAGAIHDIGYRRYEGERRTDDRALGLTMFVHTLRGAFGLGRSARSKIAPILMLVVMCLPAFIVSVVVSVTGVAALPLEPTAYAMLLQPAISIFLAVLAPAVIARDLRFRVTSLYFSRPLGRAAYVVAKLAATAVALLIVLAAPLMLLLAGVLLAKMPLDENLPELLRALGGSVLLAVLLAGVGLAIAALAPRRGMGIAAIVAVLVVLAATQAVLTGLGSDTGNESLERFGMVVSPYTLVHSLTAALFGSDSVFTVQPEGALQTAAFAGAYVLILCVSLGLLALRYRKVSVL